MSLTLLGVSSFFTPNASSGGGGGGNVTFDNSTSNSGLGVDNVNTVMTVGSLTNGILMACIGIVGTGTPPQVSTVTCNDGAMTFVSGSASTSGNYNEAGFYYRLAPSAGSQTVSVVATGVEDDFMVGIISFSNVNQGTPFGTPTIFDTSGITSTVIAVSTASGDMVLGHMTCASNALGAQTVSTGTQRYVNFPGNFGSAIIGGTTPGTGIIDSVVIVNDGGTNLSVGVAVKKA